MNFFLAPLQLIMGLVIIYSVIGWAALSSIGVAIIVGILTYFISKMQRKREEKLNKAKDKRIKVISEMLDIIRYIKIAAI